MAPDEGAWPSRADFPDLADVSILARGAHATVYRARQLSTGRDVALKVDGRVVGSTQQRQRFEQEVRAVGGLSQHPGVIETLSAGITAAGHPFVVTQLCRASYEQVLANGGPLRPDEVQRIGIRISGALSAAHRNRIRHGDIKPANILVTLDGEPVLADFGVASLIDGQSGPVARAAMTPAYAPLETFHMQPSDEASDVYSLAATLYALLSGRPPRFPAEDRDLTLDEVMALCHEPIPDIPGVSQVLLGMLRAAMTNNPTGRPTAEHFQEMLESVPIASAVILSGAAPTRPQPPPAPPRVFKPEPATTVLRQRRPGPVEEEEPVTAVISSTAAGHRHLVEQVPSGIITASTGPIPKPTEPSTTVIRPGTGPIPRPDEPQRPLHSGPHTGGFPRIEEPATTVIRPGTGPMPPGTNRPPSWPATDSFPRISDEPTAMIRPGTGAHPRPSNEPTALIRPEMPTQRPPSAYSPPYGTTGTIDALPTDGWAVAAPSHDMDREIPPIGPWGQPPEANHSYDDRLPVLASSRDLTTRRERRIAERGGEERSEMPKIIAVCAAVLVLVVATVIGAINFLSDDTPDSGDTTAKTEAESCAVEQLGVACLPEPMCFEGRQLTDGDGFANATEVDCSKAHVWEAYAFGELTTEIDNPSYQAVSGTPEVLESCLLPGEDSPMRALLGAQAGDWASDVLPPTQAQFDEGEMTFLCVARRTDSSELKSSYF
ncbi:serine/threonine protein kinase [Stackebrandtia soli]|uniref:serine/threonine protein kinase n=1 Tax=Stackebrandtia soli TaxID=1892856 RepID=UPI0039EBA9AB